MKVLITGTSGQLGRRIKETAPLGTTLLTPLKADLNLEDYDACRNYVLDKKPDWIVNCGAYTNVDKAEMEKELAHKINALAPKAFAEGINKTKGRILHISTDFVFDGNQVKPYQEKDKTNPINHYGYSKAKGEEYLRKNINDINKVTILRTSWVISPVGKNFLLTMLRLHQTKEYIDVVSDQIGSPTSTRELARVCWKIIKVKKGKKIPTILHWSNSGVASWFDIAEAIGSIGTEFGVITAKATINPINSEDLTRAAKRPNCSILNTFNTQKELKLKPIYWRDEIKNIINEIKISKNAKL